MNARMSLLVVAILLVAINLRPAMAALGPLLDLIEDATGLDSAGAGLLTTLPVLVMGIGALFGRPLRKVLGEVNGIAWGILLIGLACACRAWSATAAGMLLSATVVGIGVALIQALLPAFIKRQFGSKTSWMMGLYTSGIMGGAAMAAASAPRLSVLLSWQYILALWSLPACLALAVWIRGASGARVTASVAGAPRPQVTFWRIPRAWLLMLFFGIGTGAYTLILAWLPPFYVELGQSRVMAGDLLAGLTLTEVISGLAFSAVVGKYQDRRPLLIAALACVLAGLAMLLVSPLRMAFLAIVMLGLGIGALFPLSLIVTMDHIENPEASGDLAAFVQGGGYIMASVMPFFAGWIRAEFSTLTYAWAGMLGAILLITYLAMKFSPASYARMNGCS